MDRPCHCALWGDCCKEGPGLLVNLTLQARADNATHYDNPPPLPKKPKENTWHVSKVTRLHMSHSRLLFFLFSFFFLSTPAPINHDRNALEARRVWRGVKKEQRKLGRKRKMRGGGKRRRAAVCEWQDAVQMTNGAGWTRDIDEWSVMCWCHLCPKPCVQMHRVL